MAPGAPHVPGSTDPKNDGLGHGIPLGRWAGVSMSAHWTVLFTIALFADLLATSALPRARPHHSETAYWLVGAGTAVIFLLTVLVHELAHAIVARHYGMRVQSITLWMLGGVTLLDGEPPSPRADIVIAVAGPATSVVLGAISWGAAWAMGGAGLFGAALAWLGAISVLLGVFNLLPAPPLDGGRVLRGVIWWRRHDRARAVAVTERVGRALGTVMIFLGVLEVLTGNIGGLWLALIGWFIVTAAMGERYASITERLAGLTAGQIMTPTPGAVPEWWTVQQFVAQLTPDVAAGPVFVLTAFDGSVTGVLRLTELERVPAKDRDTARLRDLNRSVHARPLTVGSNTAVVDILHRLPASGSGAAVVLDEAGRPVGVIAGAEIARAAQLTGLGWRGGHRPGDGGDVPTPHVGAGAS